LKIFVGGVVLFSWAYGRMPRGLLRGYLLLQMLRGRLMEITTIDGRREWLIPLGLSIIFCFFMFLTIEDYGLIWDSHYHLPRGEAYLHFLLTGEKNYDKGKPRGSCIFVSTPVDDFLKNRDLMPYGPVTDIFGAITCTIFHKKLKLLKAVDAHHSSLIILATLTIFPLYFLTLKVSNRFVAFFTVSLLLLYPRFIGHVHNNIKDIPVVCYAIFAVYFFWRAEEEQKQRFLILSSLFAALGLGTKPTAIILFPILAVWVFSKNYKRFGSMEKEYKLWLFAYPFLAFVISLVLRPDFWLQPFSILRTFLGSFYWRILHRMKISRITVRGSVFDFKQLRHAIGSTPVVILILSVVGLMASLRWPRQDNNKGLLLFYLILALPLLATMKAGTFLYGGIRHFILFAPALCFFAATGVHYLAGAIEAFCLRYMDKKKVNLILFIMASGLIATLIIPIVRVHPFETTYHNIWVSQTMNEREKNSLKNHGEDWITDYWLNSVRQAVRWLNQNAAPDSSVVIFPNVPQVLTYNEELRRDLVVGEDPNKYADYVICVLRPEAMIYFDKKMELIENHKPVKTFISQGEPILNIYDLRQS
jgi:hypothetical protein